MKIGRLWTVAVSVCLILAVVATALSACAKQAPAPGPAATAAPQKIVLKAVDGSPLTNLLTKQFQYWAQLVNERAKGELEIQVLGGPEVIPYFDQAQALVSGTIDLLDGYTALYKEFVPIADGAHLSNLTPWEERAPGSYFDLMQAGHNKVGIYYLGRTSSNLWFYMYPKSEVKRPQDLKGMKFRTAFIYDAFYKSLGITGVTMPNSDAYSAIQQGVIDGASNLMAQNVDYKWYEVAKYAIDHRFYVGNTVALANLTTWNKIPEHLQNIMIEAQKDAERWGYDFYTGTDEANRKTMEDNGVTFIKFSPDDAKYFTDSAYNSAWDTLTKAIGQETAAKLRPILGEPR